MAKLYNVRSSPGNGNGIFATKPIAPRTVILRHTGVMSIHTLPDGQVTEVQVRDAFDQLSPDQQASFLSLPESVTKTAGSKLHRIYVGNAFGFKQGEHHITLNINQANHSCVPNTEGKPRDGPGEVAMVALRETRTGEEIYISYNTLFICMTARQRAGVLLAQ